MKNDEIISKFANADRLVEQGDDGYMECIFALMDEARASERQKFKLVFQGLKEYPKGVFPPLSKNDYEKIAVILKKEGYTLDRLAGNLMRQAYELCQEDVLRKLEEIE